MEETLAARGLSAGCEVGAVCLGAWLWAMQGLPARVRSGGAEEWASGVRWR